MAHTRLGDAAAGAALVLGIAHAVVVSVSARGEFGAGLVAWIAVPFLVMLGFAAAALALARHGDRPDRPRWAVWTAGAATVVTALLVPAGIAPLFTGDPLGVFLGPTPYALVCVPLFAALTWRALSSGGAPER
ncbi:hypothetical protein [Nocardiopsis sp. NRRL B-16309]|uniref:hypothetical protein n=1 Tax=Nocardiopsis sp. NRRL B-16309 TaxID=1519494 RepID=UPI0006AFEC2D|nr:hypothetical protein [Nocardiopsis sp. NRRL B-16309]KOX19095.1 hypothetical protein ADL05_06395 [Nocardiopsis sp. NRRL B-16309]